MYIRGALAPPVREIGDPARWVGRKGGYGGRARARRGGRKKNAEARRSERGAMMARSRIYVCRRRKRERSTPEKEKAFLSLSLVLFLSRGSRRRQLLAFGRIRSTWLLAIRILRRDNSRIILPTLFTFFKDNILFHVVRRESVFS